LRAAAVAALAAGADRHVAANQGVGLGHLGLVGLALGVDEAYGPRSARAGRRTRAPGDAHVPQPNSLEVPQRGLDVANAGVPVDGACGRAVDRQLEVAIAGAAGQRDNLHFIGLVAVAGDEGGIGAGRQRTGPAGHHGAAVGAVVDAISQAVGLIEPLADVAGA